MYVSTCTESMEKMCKAYSYNPKTFPPAGVLTGSTTVVLICCVTAVCTGNTDVKLNPAHTTHLKRNVQRRLKFVPQIPSLMREEGMKAGRKPALVQWKLPLGQAAVPENKGVIKYTTQLLDIVMTWQSAYYTDQADLLFIHQ